MKQDHAKYQPGDPRSPEAVDGCIISPDTRRSNRMPPGQTRTRKWPVLHASIVPTIDLATWTLRVFGAVKNELSFTWEEFQSLPRTKVYSDFHCVTRWSRLDNVWEGVAVEEIMRLAEVSPAAKFVIAHGYDHGWTTNIPLAEFARPDALVADLHDGEPLDPDHGAPARLIIPQLYAWKSAKWLRGLEFREDDSPGFWERGGYHDRGDPWLEERFRE